MRFSPPTARIAGLLLIPLLWLLLPSTGAAACDADARQASGSIYRICMPARGWNGDLMIWAHGFQAANEPVSIPEDQNNFGGIPVNAVFNALGFAFATNSFSKTGLAVKQGRRDLLDLLEIFRRRKGPPRRVYLLSASEGGLISTQLIEQHPQKFNAAVVACAPLGGFPEQVNYLGDTRLLFDAFFPGLIPGGAFSPPRALVDNWRGYLHDVVLPVVLASTSRDALKQWLSVAGIPFESGDFDATVREAVSDVLSYAVLNQEDVVATLGGFPFDNRDRVYAGSPNDAVLNALLPRYAVEPAALREMRSHYNTSGRPTRPMIILHTLRDPLVPFAQSSSYLQRAITSGAPVRPLFFPVDRFGHCNFSFSEILLAVLLMLVADGNIGSLQRLEQALQPEQLAQLRGAAQHYRLAWPPNAAAAPPGRTVGTVRREDD